MWRRTGCPGSRRGETNLVQKDLRESIFGGQPPGRPQSSGCTHQATQPEVMKSSPPRTTSSSTLLSGKSVGRFVVIVFVRCSGCPGLGVCPFLFPLLFFWFGMATYPNLWGRGFTLHCLVLNLYRCPVGRTKEMSHAQNHGGSNAGSSRSRALRHRGRCVAMDPATMGMVSGLSVPGGHSVLEAMLFAAAPDEAGIWRTSANDGNGSGDHEGTEAMRFSSPSPSRVRSRASPSMTSSRQSQSLSSRSSRSSKQKKPSNKQPRGQVPRDTTVGVRGRVSVAERGRIVLEAMGSGAKTPLHSPPTQSSP